MESNTVIFKDKQGKEQVVYVSDFCKITLSIQDGKVVNTQYNQSVKMQDINVSKTYNKR